ncbi:hypothetical protein ATE47_04160 [Chryseobacterium sp. IHB B 17019]|uniref:hypothetical protein n=1 Tax=Chryseobacterium sp. IHB B 17019 TaxID=1721091 RepID=UPI0007227558|nr:hypothetical protein [Chryseobacterium sp. IHB B 17019]ALR29763.1 hypothetical protein ATE47_04160 [Chryseobacterium sp. IHB B 17019]
MFKKFLEKKGYTVDKFNELEAEKQMELQNEYLGEIESQVGKAATKEEMNQAIKDELKKLSDGQIKEIADDIASIQESMKSGFGGIVVDEEKLLETIAAKQEEIKSIYKAGTGTIEIMVVPDVNKAVGTLTTTSGTITGMDALLATQLNPLQRIELDVMDIESEVTTFATSDPIYTYTYALPKDGKFEFQAEGEVKEQIDFTWKNGSSNVKTFAAWEKLTEQAVQDVKGLLSVARGYLKDRHDYDKALAIVFGDATFDIDGIVGTATPFVAGSLAASVTDPNFTDIISAGILSVRTRTNYPGAPRFNPNVAYVNPIDFFKEFTAAKDKEGRPLYPTAQLGVVVIGNTIVKQRFEIPVGKILIADLKKVMLSNYMPYTVKIGWVNDDFIKNQFVLLGESRFHLFVKELDKAAFLYDDIATIKTAITKPVV